MVNDGQAANDWRFHCLEGWARAGGSNPYGESVQSFADFIPNRKGTKSTYGQGRPMSVISAAPFLQDSAATPNDPHSLPPQISPLNFPI